MADQSTSRRTNAVVCLLAVLTGLQNATTVAQEATPAPIEYSHEQHEELREKLLKVKTGDQLPIPEDEADQGVFMAIEGTHIGRSYLGSVGPRSFVISVLRIANLSNDPLNFKSSSIKLQIDQTTIPHQPLPRSLSARNIDIRGRRLTKVMPVPDELAIEPGGVAEIPVSFLQLPDPENFSVLRLTVEGIPRPIRFDLMKMAARRLGLKTRRVGPRDCLAVFQIDGNIDSINARHLVNEIRRLTSDGATRVLVQWHSGADRVNTSVRSWLTSAANNTGKSRFGSSSSPLPSMPQGIVELHLGPFPGVSQSKTYFGGQRLHADNEDAFVSAIQTAYEGLGTKELLEDFASNDPLIQAAAISGGVGRLPEELVPRLIEISNETSAQLQRAAIAALAACSSEEAVKQVVTVIDSDDVQLAMEAIRGLRDSRYPIGQQTLRELLATADLKKRDLIANVLISEVRSEWKDLYFEYASDDRNQSLSRRAVKAIRRTGHPKIRELMTELLSSKNSSIRKEAFQELAGSDDTKSVEIAKTYTIDAIQKQTPDREMLSLIQRIGCREAVPALQKHYAAGPTSLRAALLQTIVRVGDESTVPFLLEDYRKASSSVDAPRKADILRALQQLRAPEAVELSRKAMELTNSSILQAACSVLVEDGTEESIHAMGKRLASLDNTPAMDTPANIILGSLSNVGSPWARRYMRYAQNSDSPNRRRFADRAFERLLRTSPAVDLIVEAADLEKEKKIPEAEEVYDHAVQIDPNCPNLFIFRGHLKTHSGRRAEGMKDYAKALELDPLEPVATSLHAIGIVVLGDIEGGLKEIEDKRETFKWHGVFNYNAACAYGQAIICTKPTPENVEQIADWKFKALDYIDHCVEHASFSGMRTMDEDPDLAPIADHPRFLAALKRVKEKIPAEE